MYTNYDPDHEVVNIPETKYINLVKGLSFLFEPDRTRNIFLVPGTNLSGPKDHITFQEAGKKAA